MALIIQIRRDTASNWTSANPVLAQGEMGLETDTLKIKFGDGTSTWSQLSYYSSGAVTSVNNKTGAVTLVASDVGALPDSTTIPTKTSDLDNDSGYITGIDSSDIATALGYTPEATATITALDATDSITLADNTIYSGGEQTALTIALWTSPTASSIAEIVFTSGSAETTLTYPNTIKWLGDDVSSNVFTPVASKRYTVILYYDGAETVGVVKGVA